MSGCGALIPVEVLKFSPYQSLPACTCLWVQPLLSRATVCTLALCSGIPPQLTQILYTLLHRYLTSILWLTSLSCLRCGLGEESTPCPLQDAVLLQRWATIAGLQLCLASKMWSLAAFKSGSEGWCNCQTPAKLTQHSKKEQQHKASKDEP